MASSKPKRDEKVHPPSRDVKRKQDADHTEADFLRDLDRVATNDATKRLGDRAEPRRGSSRT